MTKYLLAVNYDGGTTSTPMSEWTVEEFRAHIDYYQALAEELDESGERIDHRELTGPELAKIVTYDGATAPVVTDGPFVEFKEMLAGFTVVDVESEERAIEIAAKLSSVPGPGGVPLQQPIEVRRVMGPEDFALLHPDL